ncbi:transposase, partial [Rhodocytophaga aerolata]
VFWTSFPRITGPASPEYAIGYIPVHGLFQMEREGFIYDKQHDCYSCPQGKPLPLSRIYADREGYWKKSYRASRTDCKVCPLKQTCLGKSREKKFDVTYYQAHYQRAYFRQLSSKGQYMKKLRQSKVEPVLGTLLNFLGMRKVNTRGQMGAHKCMLMAAIAFNLKKYLRFTARYTITTAKAAISPLRPFYFLLSKRWLSFYLYKMGEN